MSYRAFKLKLRKLWIIFKFVFYCPKNVGSKYCPTKLLLNRVFEFNSLYFLLSIWEWNWREWLWNSSAILNALDQFKEQPSRELFITIMYFIKPDDLCFKAFWQVWSDFFISGVVTFKCHIKVKGNPFWEKKESDMVPVADVRPFFFKNCYRFS